MEAYVERAIELGLRETGFSDHCPLPNGLNAQVRMGEEELDYYVRRVTELRFEYRGKIDVLLGLEMDYLDGFEDYFEQMVWRYPWDYVIGSIHHLDPECRVFAWSPLVKENPAEFYARYFKQMEKMARTGLYDIIAHFDVPKRSGRPPAIEESDVIRHALEGIADAGLCLEINTSGYRHPELATPQPYPSFPIVEQALSLGIPVTVNSDAHAPEQVGWEFPRIERWLVQKGCKQLARVDKRQREFYPL
jgi:histidinol-phosphatase (PHP family)